MRDPTAEEISKAKHHLLTALAEQGIVPDDPDDDTTYVEMARNKLAAQAEYKVCVSTSELVVRVLLGVLAALLLYPLFLVGRWVAAGFKTDGKL
ncbi:hypothetical protein [Sphingosinithalassobacter sp. LHW66-3]|uniref:hypothetical protein n=1 Tax=Sphingosinithalassobacter sp. LHW66-3 TaxID=3424718 RepID=UPI003D6C4904